MSILNNINIKLKEYKSQRNTLGSDNLSNHKSSQKKDAQF